MLARTINYNGDQWRFDLFGGSRMRRSSMRPMEILKGSKRPSRVLPAVRLADTRPGCDMMTLMQKLGPQKEDWSRIQRALLERVPRSDVVEGSSRIGWFRDGTHQFRLTNQKGEAINLSTNDGCGFMKYEAAMRIPSVRSALLAFNAVQAGEATPEQRELVERIKPSGFNVVPSQAMQHYPANDEVIDEMSERLEDKLRPYESGEKVIDQLTRYQLMLGGGYEGKKFTVVPSADDRLYLPAHLSEAFDEHDDDDLLLGKAPYDKENWLTFPKDDVGTAARGDPTAEFLGDCIAIQYSYTGFDDRKDVDPDMLHGKGILIIPPKGCWPAQYAELDMACSTEDMKIHSSWMQGRARDALPEVMPCTGSFRVKDIRGNIAAVPAAVQKKYDADADGDEMLACAGYPKTAAFIDEVMEDRNRQRVVAESFKPPKSAEPAFRDGVYKAGRGEQILQVQQGDELVARASTAMTRFLSQPDAIREAMARDMMFGTYDGVQRELHDDLLDLLETESFAVSKLAPLLEMTASGIDQAHEPEAREAAELLHGELKSLGAELEAAGDLSSATEGAPLAEGLASRFGNLALAYRAAATTLERIEAILENYPVCKLHASQFAATRQPGYVPGNPELTMRNLLTMSVKMGTDSIKAYANTTLGMKIIQQYEWVERDYEERVRSVPHGKTTAQKIYAGTFRTDQALDTLDRIPTMAAAVMARSTRRLMESNLAPEPGKSVREKAAVYSEQAFSDAAEALAAAARVLDVAVTGKLAQLVSQCGAQLKRGRDRLKSPASIQSKLVSLVGKLGMSLEQAQRAVPDALRYSVVAPSDSFHVKYLAVNKAMDERGFSRTKITNHFTHPKDAFEAVSVTYRDAEGRSFDVQYHTDETFQLKTRFHDLFKDDLEIALDSTAGRSQRRALLEPAYTAYRALPRPQGYDEIEDWALEPEHPPVAAQREQAAASAGKPVLSAEVIALRRAAKALEAEVTPVMRQVLQQINGTLQGEGGHGGGDPQKHFLKSPRSLRRKLDLISQQQGIDRPQAAAQVRDALRYIVRIEPADFSTNVNAALSAFQECGLTVMRVRNGFAEEETSYAGVNVNLSTRAGQDFEVQLHTPLSLRNKLASYKHYDKLRGLQALPGPASAAGEADTLRQTLRAMAAQVPKPEGIDTIVSMNRYGAPDPAPEELGAPRASVSALLPAPQQWPVRPDILVPARPPSSASSAEGEERTDNDALAARVDPPIDASPAPVPALATVPASLGGGRATPSSSPARSRSVSPLRPQPVARRHQSATPPLPVAIGEGVGEGIGREHSEPAIDSQALAGFDPSASSSAVPPDIGAIAPPASSSLRTRAESPSGSRPVAHDRLASRPAPRGARQEGVGRTAAHEGGHPVAASQAIASPVQPSSVPAGGSAGTMPPSMSSSPSRAQSPSRAHRRLASLPPLRPAIREDLGGRAAHEADLLDPASPQIPALVRPAGAEADPNVAGVPPSSSNSPPEAALAPQDLSLDQVVETPPVSVSEATSQAQERSQAPQPQATSVREVKEPSRSATRRRHGRKIEGAASRTEATSSGSPANTPIPSARVTAGVRQGHVPAPSATWEASLPPAVVDAAGALKKGSLVAAGFLGAGTATALLAAGNEGLAALLGPDQERPAQTFKAVVSAPVVYLPALLTMGLVGLAAYIERSDRRSQALDEWMKSFPGASRETIMNNSYSGLQHVSDMTNFLLKNIEDGRFTPELKITAEGLKEIEASGFPMDLIPDLEKCYEGFAIQHAQFFPEIKIKLKPEHSAETDPAVVLARIRAGHLTASGKFTGKGADFMRRELGCDNSVLTSLEKSYAKLITENRDLFALPVKQVTVAPKAHVLSLESDPRRAQEIRRGIQQCSNLKKQALGIVVSAYPSHTMNQSTMAFILGKNIAATQKLFDDLRSAGWIDDQWRPANDQVVQSTRSEVRMTDFAQTQHRLANFLKQD
jgi:gas vesicle protein